MQPSATNGSFGMAQERSQVGSEPRTSCPLRCRYCTGDYQVAPCGHGRWALSDLRCAWHLRVSTEDGRQDIDNQRLQMRQFAQNHGGPVVIEYEDHESGGRSDRPGFNAMMRDTAFRRFDVLLFWTLDRLTRGGSVDAPVSVDAERLRGRVPQFHRTLPGFLWGIQRRDHCDSRRDRG